MRILRVSAPLDRSSLLRIGQLEGYEFAWLSVPMTAAGVDRLKNVRWWTSGER